MSASSLTFDSVVDAARDVSTVLGETPSWSYPLLNARAGAEVIVKHENAQPTGAFKVRGGVALMARLGEEERRAGVVTASTGNHAQSLAWAGARSGTPVTVVMPVTAPEGKVTAVRALGARVVIEGPTMSEAFAHAEHLARTGGLRLVSPGDEPAVVLGHATVYLELFRRHRGIDTLYVPIGSGSGAAGACLVRDALAPNCRVVGVQSEAAPAAHASWKGGRPVSAPCRTRVSGLATGSGFELPQSILRQRLDDFVLVSDDDILDAVRLMATCAHTLAEGAGAAALAGLLADPGRRGTCAVICTGGNADARELAALAAQAA
ncbi:MAG: pyridoxal-phosphate dependent enzyme [Actinomycetaceae bacterium]|nr:pyridoxal-phosphate dependent enzyme [Actinomycetaceae bacterium]